MAFKVRETPEYYEQAQPQGSALDSILPILLSLIGKRKAAKGTDSLVDTYLQVSQGTTPEAAAVPATPAPNKPLDPLAQIVSRPPVAPPAPVKKGGRRCKVDPRTGVVV